MGRDERPSVGTHHRSASTARSHPIATTPQRTRKRKERAALGATRRMDVKNAEV